MEPIVLERERAERDVDRLFPSFGEASLSMGSALGDVEPTLPFGEVGPCVFPAATAGNVGTEACFAMRAARPPPERGERGLAPDPLLVDLTNAVPAGQELPFTPPRRLSQKLSLAKLPPFRNPRSSNEVKGLSKKAISYSTTPSDHTSQLGPGGHRRPRSSGAMVHSVPQSSVL
mmetsp:Transcript_57468/g.95614  ORF Transcript_57468/g.95614 Transcript_57468/m.95614 type:complete len:174 (-) Transcript_57468:841-1362(-)